MNKEDNSNKYGTDIERLRNMKDDDIDLSDISNTTPEMWAKGIVKKGFKTVPPKRHYVDAQKV